MSTYDEALEAFDKYEDGKMTERITAALAPLADMHVDIWVEAFMLGYAKGVKSQYLPKEEVK